MKLKHAVIGLALIGPPSAAAAHQCFSKTINKGKITESYKLDVKEQRVKGEKQKKLRSVTIYLPTSKPGKLVSIQLPGPLIEEVRNKDDNLEGVFYANATIAMSNHSKGKMFATFRCAEAPMALPAEEAESPEAKPAGKKEAPKADIRVPLLGNLSQNPTSVELRAKLKELRDFTKNHGEGLLLGEITRLAMIAGTILDKQNPTGEDLKRAREALVSAFGKLSDLRVDVAYQEAKRQSASKDEAQAQDLGARLAQLRKNKAGMKMKKYADHLKEAEEKLRGRNFSEVRKALTKAEAYLENNHIINRTVPVTISDHKNPIKPSRREGFAPNAVGFEEAKSVISSDLNGAQSRLLKRNPDLVLNGTLNANVIIDGRGNVRLVKFTSGPKGAMVDNDDFLSEIARIIGRLKFLTVWKTSAFHFPIELN